MKNGLLVWNIILTLLVGYLLITKGSSKKSSSSVTETSATDTTTSGFRIAYFEMDSVASEFEEVKQLKKELAKREEDNNNELNRLSKEFRDKYNYYQQLAADGKLSAEQSQSANEEMKKMDETIKNRKMQLDQDYNDFMVRRQNDIKDKIESFIKELNKGRKYSYVVSDDPGLFYYQDTTFNITSEVIKGLNKLYPPKKASK